MLKNYINTFCSRSEKSGRVRLHAFMGVECLTLYHMRVWHLCFIQFMGGVPASIQYVSKKSLSLILLDPVNKSVSISNHLCEILCIWVAQRNAKASQGGTPPAGPKE